MPGGLYANPELAETYSRVVREAEAELGDTGRILLRPSGTEQLVRVMVEAADEDTEARGVHEVDGAEVGDQCQAPIGHGRCQSVPQESGRRRIHVAGDMDDHHGIVIVGRNGQHCGNPTPSNG